MDVNVDGELVGLHTPVEVEVESRIDFLVPAP
jgi:hypothetical protein